MIGLFLKASSEKLCCEHSSHVQLKYRIFNSCFVLAGPATIRMVSTNERPPVAMPMHVPQGHMVQQIVDENGTLQHVILSADPMAGAAAPPQGVAPTPLPSGGPSPALQGGGSSSPPTSAASSTNTSTTPGSAGATPGPQQPPTGPPGSSGQQFVPMTLYVS